jgi:putative flippase GtrA
MAAVQSSKAPTRKVATAGVAGAISAIVLFVLKQKGVEVPGDVATAVTTLIAFFLAYIVPPSTNDDVAPAPQNAPAPASP